MQNRKDRTIHLDWKRSGLALGVSMLVLLIMTAAGAALVDRELIGLEWMNYLAALILTVSSFVGALTARSAADRWLGPLVNGALVWLLLLAVNALGFDGDLSGAAATGLALLGGSGAGMLLNGGGKHRSRVRRKRRNR